MEDNNPLKKNIQFYQLVISVIVVVGAMFTSWVNVNTRLSVIETKEAIYDSDMKIIKQELKEISLTNMKILIELQNKKNK